MAKNWHERIKEARERGAFLRDDFRFASNWTDCACGEQNPRIPRFSEHGKGTQQKGAPIDARLRNLGINFADHVWGGHDNRTAGLRLRSITYAERTLAAIEKRSAEILASLDSGTKEEE